MQPGRRADPNFQGQGHSRRLGGIAGHAARRLFGGDRPDQRDLPLERRQGRRSLRRFVGQVHRRARPIFRHRARLERPDRQIAFGRRHSLHGSRGAQGRAFRRGRDQASIRRARSQHAGEPQAGFRGPAPAAPPPAAPVTFRPPAETPSPDKPPTLPADRADVGQLQPLTNVAAPRSDDLAHKDLEAAGGPRHGDRARRRGACLR